MEAQTNQADWVRAVRAHQSERRIPSIAIVASAGAHTLLDESVGTADVDHRDLPIDGTTQYRIGSITKTFTAALVTSLAAEGMLALDDRVEEHIDKTPFGRATIAQLLSHSAGVQREPVTPMWQTFVGPDETELAASLPDSEAIADPGQRWHYSNLGYAILGQIVKQVTGSTCEDLVNKRFVDPLGLTRTSWQPVDPHAIGYRVDPYQDVLHQEPDMQQRAAGMGGQMWSTTTDLIAWAQALMGRRPDVLSTDVVDAMHTLRIMTDPTTWQQAWGLGLILNRAEDRIYAGHTGAMPGFSAALVTDRSTGLAVAALANSMNAALGELALDLAESIRPTLPPEPVDSWQPGEPCPPELVGVLGSWWFEAGETVFSWRNNALHAELRSDVGATSVFSRDDHDRFRVVSGREQGEVLVINRDVTGSIQTLEWARYLYSRRPR